MPVTIESQPTKKTGCCRVARMGLVLLGDTVTLQLAEAQLVSATQPQTSRNGGRATPAITGHTTGGDLHSRLGKEPPPGCPGRSRLSAPSLTSTGRHGLR